MGEYQNHIIIRIGQIDISIPILPNPNRSSLNVSHFPQSPALTNARKASLQSVVLGHKSMRCINSAVNAFAPSSFK